MTAQSSGKFSSNFGLCDSSSNSESEGPPCPLLTVLSSPSKAFLGHLITYHAGLKPSPENHWQEWPTSVLCVCRARLNAPRVRDLILTIHGMGTVSPTAEEKGSSQRLQYLSPHSWYSRDLSEPMFVCVESVPSAATLYRLHKVSNYGVCI